MGTACIDHTRSNKMLIELNSGIFSMDITDHMPIFNTFSIVSFNRCEYFIKSFRDHSKECLD